MPPPAALNATTQPALDAIAEYLRPRWSMERNAHMPTAIRERARLLMLVGQSLSQRYGHVVLDPWRERVMPEALASFRVRRPLTQVEDTPSNEEVEEEDGEADGS